MDDATETPKPWLTLRFANLDPESPDAKSLTAAIRNDLEPISVPVSSGRLVALSAELPTWIEVVVAGLAAETLWRLTKDARDRIAAALTSFLESQSNRACFQGLSFKVYTHKHDHKIVIPDPSANADIEQILLASPSFTTYVGAWKEVLAIGDTLSMSWTFREGAWYPLHADRYGQEEPDSYKGSWDAIDKVMAIITDKKGIPAVPVDQHDTSFEYDVALSFAGEDRDYVEQVAGLLRDSGKQVFYDGFEESDLWGKDLYAYLAEVYGDKARFCIVFISKHYAEKAWTNHERKAAQARAFEERADYILPARFDDTEIPGIHKTVGYM